MISAPNPQATREVLEGGVLSLPAAMTIREVTSVRESLLEHLAATEGTVRIDGSGVAGIDGAGVQLLASLARSLEEGLRTFELVATSTALSEALAVAGLQERFPGIAAAEVGTR